MPKSRSGVGALVLAVAILVSPLVFILWQHYGSGAPLDAPSDDIVIGERQSIWSDVLEEDREYLVYVPASYDDHTFSEQAYPVLYLLDGDAHFHSVTGVIRFLSEGINGTRRIPEIIVVAIPNTERTRDLTPTHTMLGYDGEEQEFLANSGGGDNFLRFLEDELFEAIDDNYRTLPHRTLVGHSFGALLALHALVNAPHLFQGYIAIDPSLWWHDQRLVAEAAEVFQDGHGRIASVYISLANNPDLGIGNPMLMENAGRQFAANLAAVNTDAFRSSMGYYENDDHGSVPLISLYDGLLTLFDGFEIDIRRVIDDPMYVLRHYEQVSALLGVEYPPSEPGINDIGYFFIYGMENYGAAITVFSLNVELFPESYNVYDSLAEAYRLNGDRELAIENYERSLQLNPDNDNARDQIAAMTEEEDER